MCITRTGCQCTRVWSAVHGSGEVLHARKHETKRWTTTVHVQQNTQNRRMTNGYMAVRREGEPWVILRGMAESIECLCVDRTTSRRR